MSAAKKMAVHFSSKSSEWSTPQDFFDTLDNEFHFALDVCAMDQTAKTRAYFTAAEDGLRQRWPRSASPYGGPCWMNPPYGRGIEKWIEKAYNESLLGATVVCLLPARTDTKAWHKFIFPHAEVRFVPGRLKFGGHTNSAPFPSAVVIFRPPQVKS